MTMTSTDRTRAKKPRVAIADAIIDSLGRELASYRLDGCESGGGDAIRAKVKKVATTHGQSFGEAWARVHAAAYAIIDADGRATL